MARIEAETAEQAIRQSLLLRVAERYGLEAELAEMRVANVVMNIDEVQRAVKDSRYYYGIPLREMGGALYTEIYRVGESFLRGSGYEGRTEMYFSAGQDVLRSVVVEIKSANFWEWKEYLSEGFPGR
jgi:hypothetical protein